MSGRPFPRIVLVGVGGTITMIGPKGVAVLPELDVDVLAEAVPGVAEICDLKTITLSKTPSPHMDIGSIMAIAATIRQMQLDGADGFVILQGTDTMEEAAFGLELLLSRSAIVAITGAMRNPAQPGGEGPANLLDAVRVAASCDAGQGVVVVMDGAIHAPRYVRKEHTTSAAAFDSGPVTLGEVTDNGIVLYASLPEMPQFQVSDGAQPSPVALIEATIGEAGQLIEFVEQAGYRGIVVAGMGGGHVSPAMADRLEALAARMPVIIGSRTGGGTTLTSTYAYSGGEIDLARRGLIRSGWLAPRKARIALSLLLAANADRNRIGEFFVTFGGG
ncbi:MAG: asparaginase [Mesorhizobium sp.]